MPTKQKILKRHKRELNRKVKGLRCKVERGDSVLTCRGKVQPDHCEEYEYKIIFKLGQEPRFYILSPEIAPHPDIHQYPDRSLCLFYPKDYLWTDTQSIHKIFFPWFVEWILYYEYWKITGTWMGNEVSHIMSRPKA